MEPAKIVKDFVITKKMIWDFNLQFWPELMSDVNSRVHDKWQTVWWTTNTHNCWGIIKDSLTCKRRKTCPRTPSGHDWVHSKEHLLASTPLNCKTTLSLRRQLPFKDWTKPSLCRRNFFFLKTPSSHRGPHLFRVLHANKDQLEQTSQWPGSREATQEQEQL